MKTESSMSKTFDRPKLLLFRFLAHQIHPFAYAVNTFLQPALDDCRTLIYQNPKDAFTILLSLAQTFTRFAPDAELIYDDIQQFASRLKEVLEQCVLFVDSETLGYSSQSLQTAHQSLIKIIRQQNDGQTAYTDMYKNLSGNGQLKFLTPCVSAILAALTNLEKLNSLPMEMQTVLFDEPLDKTIPVPVVHHTETTVKSNGHSTNGIPSITTRLMNQMKNLSVAPSIVSSVSSDGPVETNNPTNKKSSPTIAAFPPRSAPTPQETNNGRPMSSKSSLFSSMSDYERETPTPTPSNDEGIRFGNTPAPYAGSIASSVYGGDDWNIEESREYYLNPRFTDPAMAGADWFPARGHLSTLIEQSHLNQTTSNHPHVTDEYMQEFGNKHTRPVLRGELCMTYGTPQSGPQSNCLPIGIGLSYDEMTLLSCDVHRNAQNVRLFDVQTGQLKHTISSNSSMKFHRPSAVMSNTRNNILIVERDYIFVTEPDGRLIQSIGHRSIKQLYGIATFRDRYLLTIDSKGTDNQTAENTRLLLFDPNSGKLVFEQPLVINGESEEYFKQPAINHVKGKILPEASSKPRFLAVHNDQIYIADLGRSLIYGTSIRNQFDFHCTTVFGGQGRGPGEMTDPSGLFVDSGGNVISADSKNDRIQIFSSLGEYKATVKLNERIKRPSGICTNRAGTQFYVSCYLAGCVRAFNISY